MAKNTNKIIRTICCFTDHPSAKTLKLLNEIAKPLIKEGYEIQTKRVCSNSIEALLEIDQTLFI